MLHRLLIDVQFAAKCMNTMTTLNEIYEFFSRPPKTFLNKKLAICYILDVLLQQDSYGSELIQQLTEQYPGYLLSDTVLYSAIEFLEKQSAVDVYWQKVSGRGRPRRMYHLKPHWRSQAQQLAQLWRRYMLHYYAPPVAQLDY